MKSKQYWLIKSEPLSYSIDHLKRDKTTPWTGVRNYQARNFMRDGMRVGDAVLFYHSSAEKIGIAGVARVTSVAYPDPTQFDRESDYFDPKATQENPRWQLIDIRFREKFKRFIPTDELRENPALRNMVILRPGNRLSVTPVTEAEYKTVLQMARQERGE